MEDASSKGSISSLSPSSSYRNSPTTSLTAAGSSLHRRSPSTGPTQNLPATISPSPSHTRSRSTGNPSSTAAKFAMSLSVREDDDDYVSSLLYLLHGIVHDYHPHPSPHSSFLFSIFFLFFSNTNKNANDFDGYELVEFGPKNPDENGIHG